VLFVTILKGGGHRDNGTGAGWGLPRKYRPERGYARVILIPHFGQ
jgi:hypothetical protein